MLADLTPLASVARTAQRRPIVAYFALVLANADPRFSTCSTVFSPANVYAADAKWPAIVFRDRLLLALTTAPYLLLLACLLRDRLPHDGVDARIERWLPAALIALCLLPLRPGPIEDFNTSPYFDVSILVIETLLITLAVRWWSPESSRTWVRRTLLVSPLL